MWLVSFVESSSFHIHFDSSDTVGTSGHVFDTMAMEISQLLSKVTIKIF